MSEFESASDPAQTGGESSEAPRPALHPAREDIVRGLLFSLLAVLGGAALTVLIWRLGFVASITSFLIAYGAVYLYGIGAGSLPRKGLIPLVLLIVIGVAGSFFAIVASDAWDAYSTLSSQGYIGESRWTFITDNMFRGEVLSSYGSDMAMFAVFAVIGTFAILRRLFAAAPATTP